MRWLLAFTVVALVPGCLDAADTDACSDRFDLALWREPGIWANLSDHPDLAPGNLTPTPLALQSQMLDERWGRYAVWTATWRPAAALDHIRYTVFQPNGPAPAARLEAGSTGEEDAERVEAAFSSFLQVTTILNASARAAWVDHVLANRTHEPSGPQVAMKDRDGKVEYSKDGPARQAYQSMIPYGVVNLSSLFAELMEMEEPSVRGEAGGSSWGWNATGWSMWIRIDTRNHDMSTAWGPLRWVIDPEDEVMVRSLRDTRVPPQEGLPLIREQLGDWNISEPRLLEWYESMQCVPPL